MNENTKNWMIGGLIVFLLFLGYKLLFVSSSNQFSPPANSTTEINNIKLTDCISAQDSWNYIGQEKCVEYYVASPFRSGKGNVFLNEKRDYKNGFTVWIPAGSVNNFPGDPISNYGYKTIQVTGQIRMYQAHPEIIANSPDQIRVK